MRDRLADEPSTLDSSAVDSARGRAGKRDRPVESLTQHTVPRRDNNENQPPKNALAHRNTAVTTLTSYSLIAMSA